MKLKVKHNVSLNSTFQIKEKKEKNIGLEVLAMYNGWLADVWNLKRGDSTQMFQWSVASLSLAKVFQPTSCIQYI